MFCPNCGKDCAEAKFCPECGQELSAAAEEKQATDITSRIPLGKYKAACCSLELKEEGLVVHSSFANKNKATYIPYDKLKKVLYIRTYNAIEDAYLVLRWEENEQLPIPEGNNLNLDDTTVRIVDHMVEHLVFYHIFYLLKLLAPKAEFRIENGAVNIPNLEKLEKDHDIAPYFEEYNPYRQVATKMLRKDTGMKKKAAKVLIDRYFDSQHKALYADNAEAILLDLDKAIKGVLPCGNVPIQRETGREISSQTPYYEDRCDTSACAEEKFCEDVSSRIPFGIYKGVCSSLELKKAYLVVRNSFSNSVKTTYIPYDKLTTVLFFRTCDYFDTTYLLLRWEGNQQLAIPELKKRYLDLDATTVKFVEPLVFYHIFCLLKFLAPDTAEFRIANGCEAMPGLEDGAKGVDLAPYYEQYNPCRQEAVKTLRNDTGMKRKTAKVLIDQYFDSQHEVLYADNPEMVLRDLDRAIKRLTPKQIAFDRQKAQLEASGVVFCPECLSTDITFKKVRRKVDLYTGHYQNPIIKLLASIHVTLLLVENSKNPYQIQCTCQKCQHAWLPSEK